MAKHTALLLGCGTIGAEVARLLVADEVFSGVLIADQDVARVWLHSDGAYSGRLNPHHSSGLYSSVSLFTSG
jgi:hypothetical protein